MSHIDTDPQLQELGRAALMIFRGAREDGSLVEAFWATAATILAVLKKDEE